ncbi:MAG: TatD family hydrolase [Candidatus Nanoarchaeia archaeon]|nr:TatD family hydrolase [Candidatus Nanoarchaeia archaeon]
MLADIHCHLDFPDFEKDLDSVIERAEKAGVVSIVTAGLNNVTNAKALEISKKYPAVKAALGIYPEFAAQMGEEAVKQEIEFIRKQKPFAVSEVGLDATYPDMEKQKEVFKQMVSLAKDLKIPLIVHSRGAEKEVFDVLKEMNARKVVVHCFSGKLSLAKQMEKEGYFFSIPAIVSYSSQFRELVKTISSSHLLTETDAPFLSAVKGERNEPASVKQTAAVIASIKGVSAEEMENMLFSNFQKLFMQ